MRPSFGKHSKRIRQKLNLTQKQFAAILGVHEMTVSRWERKKDVGVPNHVTIQQFVLIEQSAQTLTFEQKKHFHLLLETTYPMRALAYLINLSNPQPETVSNS